MNATNTQKVALITGAARRVGEEIARALHARGVRVIIHYRNSATLAEAICKELNAIRPDSAAILQGDLTATHSLAKLITAAAAVWQGLDILVNSASGFYPTPIAQANEQQWEDLFAANLKAPYFLCQAAIPYLQKSHGHIINITDLHASYSMRDYSIYCMSKAGLQMLTKALAKELGPEIHVNAIAPGVVAWPEGENALSKEQQQGLITKAALQRPGSAAAIAKAVLYLALDSEYITGQTIHVDGGRML